MSVSRNSRQIEFGTDGWRGIIADDFTFANVRKVTRAIASYIETAYTKDQPILVAYDTRFLADQFALAAAEVLADQGWTVKITEQDCPTPVIAYNARHLKSAGALMFTASHNPAVYCGIKYIPDYAGPATPEITNLIVANIEKAVDLPPNSIRTGQISTFDPKPEYLRFIYNLIDVQQIRRAQLKVKYDALHSTSRGYLDTALRHCGCQVETFNTNRDVLFGGGLPEPKREQLIGLAAAVKTGADLGLATDGDGDRFGVVDQQGNVLTANEILLLLTRHLIEHKVKTGAIVRTVATTHLLDNLAAKYGLELYETPVGFKYIGQKMRETTVLIGGEESGGLSIVGHIPEKDGILANLLVVEAIAYANKPLSQLLTAAITTAKGPTYNQRLDFPLVAADTQAIAYLSQHPPAAVAGIKVKAVGRKDGVKLYLEDGSWILYRLSGTEPLMRVSWETNSPEQQTRIATDIKRLISQLS